MLYTNTFYNLLSFLYDKSCTLTSSFFSLISNGLYIPNACKIEFVIINSNFNNADARTKKLLRSIIANENRIKELLISKFSFGTSRFIGLFQQRQLKFINGGLRIYIRNNEDLENLVKIWFLIEREKLADKFINRMNIDKHIDNFFANNELLKDTRQDIDIYIKQLKDNKNVFVITYLDDKFVLCKINSINLLKILYNYGSIIIETNNIKLVNNEKYNEKNSKSIDLDKYIICLDSNLYEIKKSLFVDAGITAEISNLYSDIYCIYLDDKTNVITHRMYAKNIRDLLDQNYRLNLDIVNVFTSSLKEDRYFLSSIVLNPRYTFDYNSDNDNIIYQNKAINYGIDIYGISGKNSFFVATNRYLLNLGIELCLNRDISIGNIVSEIQANNTNSWFCKNNASILHIVNFNRGFLNKIINFFAVVTNSSTKIFDRNYVHGFSNEEEFAMVYNLSKLSVNKLVDYLVLNIMKFVNVDHNSLFGRFVINNLIYHISSRNILINNSINYLQINPYEQSDLLNISQMLDLHGYRNYLSYSSIISASSVLNNILSTKFFKLTYMINNNNSVSVLMSSKPIHYRNLIMNKINNPMGLFNTNEVTSLILENNCILPAYAFNLTYVSNYFVYELETNKLISQKIYASNSSSDVFSDSFIIKLNVSSNKLLEKLYIKDVNTKLTTVIFLDNFTRNSYTYTFVKLSKNVSKNSNLSIKMGTLCSLNTVDDVNVKIINDEQLPSFILHNAAFLLRNNNIYNQSDFDFVTALSYSILTNRKDIIEMGCILDILADVKQNRLKTSRFFDIFLSYNRHILSIPKLGSLYLAINLKYLRDNLSLINFRFISHVN